MFKMLENQNLIRQKMTDIENTIVDTAKLIVELRQKAVAVYFGVEAPVANDLSDTMRRAADALERTQRERTGQ